MKFSWFCKRPKENMPSIPTRSYTESYISKKMGSGNRIILASRNDGVLVRIYLRGGSVRPEEEQRDQCAWLLRSLVNTDPWDGSQLFDISVFKCNSFNRHMEGCKIDGEYIPKEDWEPLPLARRIQWYVLTEDCLMIPSRVTYEV